MLLDFICLYIFIYPAHELDSFGHLDWLTHLGLFFYSEIQTTRFKLVNVGPHQVQLFKKLGKLNWSSFFKNFDQFFFPTSWKVCPLFFNILPSWGPDCPDGSSFCRLSSSGQDCSVSHCHYTHALCQISVYPTFHWDLKVATHCCVVVHWCFTRDQPDTTAVTWSQCPYDATSMQQHARSSIHAAPLQQHSRCSTYAAALTLQHCFAALKQQHWCSSSHAAAFMQHLACSCSFQLQYRSKT